MLLIKIKLKYDIGFYYQYSLIISGEDSNNPIYCIYNFYFLSWWGANCCKFNEKYNVDGSSFRRYFDQSLILDFINFIEGVPNVNLQSPNIRIANILNKVFVVYAIHPDSCEIEVKAALIGYKKVKIYLAFRVVDNDNDELKCYLFKKMYI